MIKWILNISKNSLKRRKKQETVKTMAQNIPKDYGRETQDQTQKENVKPSEGKCYYTPL